MPLVQFICIFFWALCFNIAAASNSLTDIALKARNAPGTTDIDTFQAIKRAISAARVQGKDTVTQNTTSLEGSWNGAVLFSFTEYA